MKWQQEISRENLERKINEMHQVLIEDVSFDGKYYIGRTMQDVPDIDGLVYIKVKDSLKKERINQFAFCRITGIQDYDLIAEIVDKNKDEKGEEKCKF